MPVMPVGTHNARVTHTALSASKEKKTQQIVVGFENADGEHITAYLACTEKAWPYTEEKLRTLGWDPMQRGYRFEELNDEPSPIKDAEAEIVVEVEEYNGKPNNRVKYINPPGGGRVERMEATEAVSFADQLRKRLGVSGVATASARRLPRQAEKVMPAPNGTADESDIPF